MYADAAVEERRRAGRRVRGESFIFEGEVCVLVGGKEGERCRWQRRARESTSRWSRESSSNPQRDNGMGQGSLTFDGIQYTQLSFDFQNDIMELKEVREKSRV